MFIHKKYIFNYLFKIFLSLILLIILNKKAILKSKNLTKENNKYQIKENKLILSESGKFLFNKKKQNLNVIIKNNNIKLFFNNSEIYSNSNSLILIEKNIKNTYLYFNNCIISNSFNFPLLKINDNSDLIISAYNTVFIGGIIFFNEYNDNNIFYEGYFHLKKNKIYHKKLKINIINNYTIYYENYKLKIKSLIFQIHPFLINIDNKNYKKFFFRQSDRIFNKEFKILKNVNDLINIKEKVIITMTSWKKRIENSNRALEILLKNTYIPNKIILNLAIEEFPKKNKELPKNILNLLKFQNFEIFWVEKNNKVFKKLIPTLNRFKDDLIITTDDDVLYPYDFIEKILKLYIKNGSNKPMSFGAKSSDWKIRKIKINSHYGAGSIVKYKYFGEKLNELYNETTKNLINKGIKCFDDALYTYAAILNGYKYLRVNEYNIKIYVKKSIPLKYSYSKKNKKNLNKYHFLIRNYIFNKYNKTFENLVKQIK